MRRRADELLPIERDILATALRLRRRGTDEFHGFGIARALQDESGARNLLAHGTLYKALGRLEDMGFLASRWENPEIAEEDSRPRRRLYQVTAAGEEALASAAQAARRQSRATTGQLVHSWRC